MASLPIGTRLRHYRRGDRATIVGSEKGWARVKEDGRILWIDERLIGVGKRWRPIGMKEEGGHLFDEDKEEGATDRP